MYSVKIIYDPKLQQVAEFQIDKNIQVLEKNLVALMYKTRDVMRQTIATKAQRKFSGNLSRAIDTEIVQLQNGISVGVGNIDTLNKYAQYWYVVNYGKSFSTGKPFIPGGVKGYDRHLPVHPVGGGNVIYPISRANVGFKPIRPMNFIETTLNWLSNQISTL